MRNLHDVEKMDDNSFFDLANNQGDVAMDCSREEAEYLIGLYDKFVSEQDEELRDTYRELDATDVLDVFDAYATLRINEVAYDVSHPGLNSPTI